MVVPPVLLELHRSSPSAPISTSSRTPTRARMVCLGSIRSRGSHVRRRRILADDVHRFILIRYLGQALRAAVIPTGLFSRAFGDPPAQGFRGRPRPTCLISVPHVPHRKTISGPLQISTMGRLYREFGVTSPQRRLHVSFHLQIR